MFQYADNCFEGPSFARGKGLLCKEHADAPRWMTRLCCLKDEVNDCSRQCLHSTGQEMSRTFASKWLAQLDCAPTTSLDLSSLNLISSFASKSIPMGFAQRHYGSLARTAQPWNKHRRCCACSFPESYNRGRSTSQAGDFVWPLLLNRAAWKIEDEREPVRISQTSHCQSSFPTPPSPRASSSAPVRDTLFPTPMYSAASSISNSVVHPGLSSGCILGLANSTTLRARHAQTLQMDLLVLLAWSHLAGLVVCELEVARGDWMQHSRARG